MIRMLMAVNSEKRISGMTFNEAVICHLLFRNPEHALTVSRLCRYTNMQKSLMNRTLTIMEEKHLIERTKSEEEIVETLKVMKGKVRIIASVDTLDNLCKGGRLSSTFVAIGNIAKLKPIITVTKEGTVSVMAKK